MPRRGGIPQPESAEVAAVDEDPPAVGAAECHHQRDQRALPEPLVPTSAVVSRLERRR